MIIHETNLAFGSLSSRASTRRIILHHAEASTCSPQQIHAWHKNNGWSGAGYHFLVRKDGNVYRLRPEWALGAHASGNNSDSIGICFEGSFMRETMGQKQIEAGQALIAYLKGKYGISKVQRHKDVCSTDCPGTNFPFAAIVNGANYTSEVKTTTAPKQDDGKLEEDGVIGYLTAKRWQEIVGSPYHDGVFSGQISSCQKYHPSVIACTYDRYGSESIRIIQRICGVDNVDGLWGRDTSTAIQQHLKHAGHDIEVDGVFGPLSAKALQKQLNTGKF